ncbi:MAG: SDR family NAD(P)-dependent oxidoreductase [Trueperaceae bacterium]|nr:SDR family NAD(P)-dependent oxidoreductase [Trueperaceae bacterium]
MPPRDSDTPTADPTRVPSPFDLSGRVAIVTGAARGIGRQIALTLAGAGAHVIVADRNEDGGRAVAAELQDAGRSGRFAFVDVTDSASVDALVRNVLATEGTLDVSVHNAGVAVNTPAEETSDEEWLRVLDVNLNGVFRCCRAVAGPMLLRGQGAIVNIASMSGVISNTPQPQAHYNASKAGVITLTKSLAGEWAERGVRVNAVSPGYIGTEMTRAGMEHEAWRDRWLAMTPMGRVGEPHEIANAVWYLASDASSFATGTNLLVDGGYTSW